MVTLLFDYKSVILRATIHIQALQKQRIPLVTYQGEEYPIEPIQFRLFVLYSGQIGRRELIRILLAKQTTLSQQRIKIALYRERVIHPEPLEQHAVIKTTVEAVN
jgi:hypothetical protein